MDADSVVSQVQRRIELQSPEDLTYLVTNVRNAATARINEAFPHVDGHEGEDELRNQIEALVNEVRWHIWRCWPFPTSLGDGSITPD